ncbi:MAG: glucan biosynthesis glucosyltransferase, partial [Hyphomicrobiales bacterium]|nr:glucan biosynthesis glucosyltransferase [Hyphomicrobiales bacterium]
LLAPAIIVPSLPLTLGYIVAIPFAVISTSPRLGDWLERIGLCAIPEEISPPLILLRLDAPHAIEPSAATKLLPNEAV